MKSGGLVKAALPVGVGIGTYAAGYMLADKVPAFRGYALPAAIIVAALVVARKKPEIKTAMLGAAGMTAALAYFANQSAMTGQ